MRHVWVFNGITRDEGGGRIVKKSTWVLGVDFDVLMCCMVGELSECVVSNVRECNGLQWM